ncbi:trans-anethole oxidase [Fusarium longipes]|uniref:Trans-anethole oxidase n=1 Tax=Fusarium longipes TaxID=694270 RepID=A0A395SKN5_9HYPO|nr:trans-anethole oxidase [Fusarium longipes]
MSKDISPKGYHWISEAIQGLDPETDYEIMWRLMACYRSSDFMNNMIYALTFPNFIITTHGCETVWRSDGGKVVKQGAQRVEDTENYNMTWWHYGPSDKRCRDAVDRINKLHASLARQYPGNFSFNEDFVYVTTFSAVLMHRLRLRLGLSGFTEKEKIAAHHFWRDMTPLFIKEDGNYVHGYPDDFEGCLQFCHDYEGETREFDPKMQYIGLAIMNQFAFRYFPPGLRWFGVSIVKALSLPSTLEAMRIEPVNPVLTWFIVFTVGTLMRLAEILLPDPRESFWMKIEKLDTEQSKLRKADIKKSDKAYRSYIEARWSAPGCPFYKKEM